jgi:hypothetical protein
MHPSHLEIRQSCRDLRKVSTKILSSWVSWAFRRARGECRRL